MNEEKDSKRLFTRELRTECWQKAMLVPGRDPDRWRLDPVGNIVCAKLTGCEGCLCHEYDHIVPHAKGGRTDVDNCQILQSRVNRYKGALENNVQQQKQFSCAYSFTPLELDAVEIALYGDIRRTDTATAASCRVKSYQEFTPEWQQRLATRRPVLDAKRQAAQERLKTWPHCENLVRQFMERVQKNSTST